MVKVMVQLPEGLSVDDIAAVAGRFGATRVRLFGSRARGQARPDSDLDLLVDLAPGHDLLDLIGLKQELEQRTGVHVDVLTEQSLSNYFRADVLTEAVAL